MHSSSLSSTGNCIHIYNLMSSTTWWPMAVCSLHINRIRSFFRPYLLTLWDSGKSKGLWTYFDPKIVSLALFFAHIQQLYNFKILIQFTWESSDHNKSYKRKSFENLHEHLLYYLVASVNLTRDKTRKYFSVIRIQNQLCFPTFGWFSLLYLRMLTIWPFLLG